MFKYATVHNLLEVVFTISVKTIIYVYKITIPFYKFTITCLQIHVIFSTSSQLRIHVFQFTKLFSLQCLICFIINSKMFTIFSSKPRKVDIKYHIYYFTFLCLPQDIYQSTFSPGYLSTIYHIFHCIYLLHAHKKHITILYLIIVRKAIIIAKQINLDIESVFSVYN